MADRTMVAGTGQPRRRLNPFAFPAETDARFVLLVVAAVMLALSLGGLMSAALQDTGVLSEPSFESQDYPDIETLDDETFDQLVAENIAEVGRAAGYLALPMLLTVAVLGVALVIYRAHPARIRRRKLLQPLTSEMDARLLDAVAALAAEADIQPSPVVEIGVGSRTADGQAFGLRGRYALRLGGNLRLLLRKAPARFRAIVMHELAHIANRDVGPTYLAQSLWASLVGLTIGPLVVFLTGRFAVTFFSRLIEEGVTGYDWLRLLTETIPTALQIAAQVLLTLAVAAAIRASLLRVREIYADWRAALWGVEAPLVAILGGGGSRQRARDPGRWWRLHPSPDERVAALRDPDRLFRIAPDLPVFAGILLSFVLSGMVVLVPSFALIVSSVVGVVWLRLAQYVFVPNPGFLSVLLFDVTGTLALVVTPAISAIILLLGASYLIVGTVGVSVQRESVAAVLSDRRGCGMYGRLLLPALLLSAGMQIGLIIVPASFFAAFAYSDAPNRLVSSFFGLALMPVWVLGTTVLAWLWLAYVRYFSIRLLGRHTGHTPPRGSRRLLTLLSSVLLWVLMLPAIAGAFYVGGVVMGDAASILPLEVFPLTLGLALGAYGLVAGGTWGLVGLMRILAPARCPECRTPTQTAVAAGQACHHCEADLTPWLYAGGAELSL